MAMIFISWEPALWTLKSQVGVVRMSQKTIAIFGYKQWLLSIDMKTKVVQHVPRIIFSVFKVFKFSGFQLSSFQVFKIFRFPAPVWRSDIFNWHFFVVTLYHCILKENLWLQFQTYIWRKPSFELDFCEKSNLRMERSSIYIVRVIV